jgi:hypothetical protein
MLSIKWLNVGDLVVWDNTCTLHRATGLKGSFRRDMRRCGVSPTELIRDEVLKLCPGEQLKPSSADVSDTGLRRWP